LLKSILTDNWLDVSWVCFEVQSWALLFKRNFVYVGSQQLCATTDFFKYLSNSSTILME
jgi:hypothetical protein